MTYCKGVSITNIINHQRIWLPNHNVSLTNWTARCKLWKTQALFSYYWSLCSKM